MMALRSIGIALGLIGGIVLATLLPDATPPAALLAATSAAGGLLTAIGLFAERRWRQWHPAAILAATFLCTLPLGFWRTATQTGSALENTLPRHLQSTRSGTAVGLRGIVSREPELRTNGQLDLQIRVQEIRIDKSNDALWLPVTGGEALVRVFTYTNNTKENLALLNQLAAPQTYGYRLELNGPYRPIDPPLNPGEFDYASFLRQNGASISLRCHVARVNILEESRGNPLTELALAAKADFLETFKRTIRAPASRLAAAATLGTRRAVEDAYYRDQDIAKTFRHAGVGHVLAVSGLHVSVIAVLLFALFRMTGTSPRVFVPPLIFFLILFALLTGARPSSVRAVVMNSVILTAIAYFRCDIRSATAIGLSLSSFLILLRTPTVLFAPSFLLSYGAVLSLIILAPPFDRFLRTLRGFSLFFFIGWFSLLLTLAGCVFHWLLDPLNLFSLAGLLWLMLIMGTRLNHRFPRMWSVGMEKIPAVIRMFFAAQLAIQIGMMIPLSAWFFGQFPVAGVLVNLFAIPAIGILVQLGMLVGLIGLIPVIGPVLAMPFGATTTLVGELFMLISYLGATVFPYPATPMPTPFWMFTYFTGIAVLLVLEQHRTRLLDIFYRLAPIEKAAPIRSVVTLSVPILLLLLPLIHAIPRIPAARHIDILAVGRYPVILLTGKNASAFINGGDRLDGERILFDRLRARGATRLGTAILPSPDPRAGIEGTTALLDKMHIDTCLLPVLPAPDQSLTEAMGDGYLTEQAAKGVSWAHNYETAFDALRGITTAKGTPMAAMGTGPLLLWQNVTLQALPLPENPPQRFATSAMTPILHATINGISWVIITDTTPEAVAHALAASPACDVLIAPNLSTQVTYVKWLNIAIRTLHPRLLIIAGDSAISDAIRTSIIGKQKDLTLIETGRDGAVSAILLQNNTTRFKTYRPPQRTIDLPPNS